MLTKTIRTPILVGMGRTKGMNSRRRHRIDIVNAMPNKAAVDFLGIAHLRIVNPLPKSREIGSLRGGFDLLRLKSDCHCIVVNFFNASAIQPAAKPQDAQLWS